MEYDFIQFIQRADYNAAGLSGSYQVLNGAGFAEPIKMLKIYNGSNVDIDISYDGVTAHDYFPAGSTLILDLQANHDTASAYGMGKKVARKGQQIWGKGSAGVGFLRIVGIY